MANARHLFGLPPVIGRRNETPEVKGGISGSSILDGQNLPSFPESPDDTVLSGREIRRLGFVAESRVISPSEMPSETSRRLKAALGTIATLAAVGSVLVYAHQPGPEQVHLPLEGEPQTVYVAKPGDTEWTIAAKLGYAGNTSFIDMLNSQLPKQYQGMRIVHPGDKFRIPK